MPSSPNSCRPRLLPLPLPQRLRRPNSEARGWLRARELGVAAAAQFCGLACALAFAPAGVVSGLVQGIAASLIGARLGLPRWWRWINLALPIAAWSGLAQSLDPLWYLAAFGATFLVFGLGTLRSGVPLYFSGERVGVALAGLLPERQASRFLDAGSGIGTMLVHVAARRPEAGVEGVEAAVGPWLLSAARALLGGGRFRARLGDLWDADFGPYDVVYAFLSPAPMAALWDKARREMHPGSLLVSNSFAVPGVAPTRVIDLDGAALYLWRM